MRVALLILVGCFAAGCASTEKPRAEFPPEPSYPLDHRYTLDELTELSIHRNASLDVARYESEAAQGLVDQVKALWLPTLRYDFSALAYSNDLNYKGKALGLVSLNVPMTGAYNIVNSLAYAQILSTGGKRTSGLKQAKMYAAIKKLEVLRQQDQVAQDVATYYLLICLATNVDSVLEDAVRRIRVFRQVAGDLNRRGSLRSNNLDFLEADFVVAELDQLRIAVQAGRQQAYLALKHFVGVPTDQPLMLQQVSLPPAVTPSDVLRVSTTAVKGFLNRPETDQVNLFTKIRNEQVKFAKAQWAPNIVLFNTYLDTQGNHHSILEQADGLIAALLVDIPIYDASRLGKLREALGMEQASLAFQREVESLITLEIEVTAIDTHKALATVLKAGRARQIMAEHYSSARQAYNRELVPASSVVIAIALDAVARLQHLQALFAYHSARAALKRVTADREQRYGY